MPKMAGKDVLMEVLREHDVRHVFGIPGATEIQFMEAVARTPELSYILGLHEVVCMGMASGYARATGKPGFLNLHTAISIYRRERYPALAIVVSLSLLPNLA